MSWIINDHRYDGTPCSKHPEEITRAYINNKLFICPRCGMVFSRNSKHNFGTCCSFCATDKDIREQKERYEQMRQQLRELQEEVERSFENEK